MRVEVKISLVNVSYIRSRIRQLMPRYVYVFSNDTWLSSERLFSCWYWWSHLLRRSFFDNVRFANKPLKKFLAYFHSNIAGGSTKNFLIRVILSRDLLKSFSSMLLWLFITFRLVGIKQRHFYAKITSSKNNNKGQKQSDIYLCDWFTFLD